MKFKSKAFTLVEILLVSSLVAVLGIAVYRSFSNGLKLWAKVQRINRGAETTIFLERFAEDLRVSVGISNILFKGTPTKISFPAIVMTSADPKSSRSPESIIDQIGMIQYCFDHEQHAIFRQQANYGQALKDKWAEQTLVASGINDISLKYETNGENGFAVKSEINGIIPSGVIVDIHFSDDSGEHQFKRYLWIPIGK
jgi:hypothetical protein